MHAVHNSLLNADLFGHSQCGGGEREWESARNNAQSGVLYGWRVSLEIYISGIIRGHIGRCWMEFYSADFHLGMMPRLKAPQALGMTNDDPLSKNKMWKHKLDSSQNVEKVAKSITKIQEISVIFFNFKLILKNKVLQVIYRAALYFLLTRYSLKKVAELLFILWVHRVKNILLFVSQTASKAAIFDIKVARVECWALGRMKKSIFLLMA